MKNVFSPTCPHRAGVSGARRGTGTPGLYIPTTVSSMLSSSSARNTMNRMSFRECRLSCSRRSSASSLRAMTPGLSCGRGARSGTVRGRGLPRSQGSPGPARWRGVRGAALTWRPQTVPGVPPSAHVRRARSHQHLRSGGNNAGERNFTCQRRNSHLVQQFQAFFSR